MKRGLVLISDRDLRVRDNPALFYAFEECEAVVVLFVYHKQMSEIGSAAKVWMYYALKSLDLDLQKYSQKLIIRVGELSDCLKDFEFDIVYYNTVFEPEYYSYLEANLPKNRQIRSYKASLLFDPREIKNGQNTFFKVFTPFWRECIKQSSRLVREPVGLPHFSPAQNYKSLDLDDLKLLPSHSWHLKISNHWNISEKAGLERLDIFTNTALKGYKENRNIPAVPSTSQLSPYIRFGQISVRYIFYYMTNLIKPENELDIRHFLFEIGWREFAYHLLWNFPALSTDNFRPEFDNFDWQEPDPIILKLWQKGRTGYPIVDAGMRQLWETGWMHNRIRMITGSFLVKDLLFHWKLGERWFWDCLVDADKAVNAASWQWVSGTGADAAPYFRIFNPMLQTERFDPESKYIKTWIPNFVCDNYLQPIVDHSTSRDVAMMLYGKIKGDKNETKTLL